MPNTNWYSDSFSPDIAATAWGSWLCQAWKKRDDLSASCFLYLACLAQRPRPKTAHRPPMFVFTFAGELFRFRLKRPALTPLFQLPPRSAAPDPTEQPYQKLIPTARLTNLFRNNLFNRGKHAYQENFFFLQTSAKAPPKPLMLHFLMS